MFGCSGGLEGDADGRALPCGRGAGGIGRCVFRFRNGHALALEKLLQHRLASADLRNDGIDFLAIFGDAAVGRIVAIPTGCGVECVELGKVDGRNVSSDAVDEKPSTALPLPVRRGGGFLGKAVIHAEGTPDDEQPVGHIVRGAKREFLDAGIDQKRANLQGKGVSPLLCPGEPWNRVPLTKATMCGLETE